MNFVIKNSLFRHFFHFPLRRELEELLDVNKSVRLKLIARFQSACLLILIVRTFKMIQAVKESNIAMMAGTDVAAYVVMIDSRYPFELIACILLLLLFLLYSNEFVFIHFASKAAKGIGSFRDPLIVNYDDVRASNHELWTEMFARNGSSRLVHTLKTIHSTRRLFVGVDHHKRMESIEKRIKMNRKLKSFPLMDKTIRVRLFIVQALFELWFLGVRCFTSKFL